MFRLFVKGVLAAALALGTVNSFAQAGVKCAADQCSCNNGSIQNPSQCCGSSSCTYSGGTCSCT